MLYVLQQQVQPAFQIGMFIMMSLTEMNWNKRTWSEYMYVWISMAF